MASDIHKASKRVDNVFVAINCGALSENLLESELFGHAKGSFAGAVNKYNGLFREADGGTLFLDEIGDMPLGFQAKMLRFLQERVIVLVSGRNELLVDIRVFCVTHRYLLIMINVDTFL